MTLPETDNLRASSSRPRARPNIVGTSPTSDVIDRPVELFKATALPSVAYLTDDAGLYGLDRPGVAWEWMKQTGEAPAGVDWVRPQVAEAWARCIDEYSLPAGVDFVPRNNPADACPRDFELWRRGSSGALATSLSATVYSLRSFLDDNCVTLLLSDPTGRLVYLLDAGLKVSPAGVHMARIGADWHESNLGNNGMGTAAALKAPAAFEGKEHFARSFHPYATAGCPVHAPDGSIAALLGMITDRRDAAKPMLGFLRIACQLLETNLFDRVVSDGVVLHVRDGDLAETGDNQACLIAGKIAVADDGRIEGANQSALDLFGAADHAQVLGKNVTQFIGTELAELSRPTFGGIALTNFGRALSVEVHQSSSQKILLCRRSQSAQPLQQGKKPTTASCCAPSTGEWQDSILEAALQKASGLQEQKISLLITGESGVGKDYLVRRLHATGPRKDKALVAINCAAIPRDLVGSELFGYVGGSFTGARSKGKCGKFVEADKGTLFLDEIGDMALDLQATLLRVLDSSEVVPIGASKPIPVDVRVVAATNCGLQEMVQKGAFRRDLYYRLNGVQLWLPPLRERPDRLRLIAQLMRQEQAALGGDEEKELSEDVWRIFFKHPWPGNIREVRNVLRSLIAMNKRRVIEVEDLPRDFLAELDLDPHSNNKAQASEAWSPASAGIDSSLATDLPVGLADWEAQAVRKALLSSDGNIAKAARTLGITRATLYYKMARYGLRSDRRIVKR